MGLSFGIKLSLLLLILTGIIISNLGIVAIPFVFLLFFLLYYYGTYFLGASWKAVPMNKAVKMVNAINIRNKRIYDLGSGDGRILVLASKNKAHSVGIEIDPLRCLISLIKIKFSGLRNCKIIWGSFFKTNLKNADVVFMYLPERTVKKLEEKFIKELKRDARVVSYVTKCSKLRLVRNIKKERIYVYIPGRN